MITCSVCGHLNDSSNATCENCGSDLSDSLDWDMIIMMIKKTDFFMLYYLML